MKYKLFIGRWSPFHDGHKYIIDSYVNNGQAVCIAIRDTPISESDPFTAELRKHKIEKIYKGNPLVKVITIPDIDTVCVGRDVGYSIMQVPQNISTISGTKERKKTKGSRGKCIWLTGLPCSGKTILANVYSNMYLKKNEIDHQILDGDVFRKEMTPRLGFSQKDRRENVLMAATIAKTVINYGAVVVCAFVSPSIKVRSEVKKLIGINNFIEIYVKASPKECIKRDTKGMWRSALKGEIKDFTGVDSPYDIPTNADGIIDTEKLTIGESVYKLIRITEERGINENS